MKYSIITIDETTAQVTKAFQKQARIFGTPEYNLWKAYREDFPDAKMTTKTIKKNPNKISYKNLTFKNIETYIKAQDNAAELLKEFETAKAQSGVQSTPYRAVLAWFLQTFPNYDSYKEFFKNRSKNADDNEYKAVDSGESHVFNLEKAS